MRTRISMALIVLSACGAFVCTRDAGAQGFKEANQLYKQGKYDQAIGAYEQIVHAGFESGNLYYNLGNGYFKKGELGRALLNYERSRLFIPADSDLKSNYNFVRSVLNVRSRGAAGPRALRLIDNLFDAIGINGLTMTVSALWIIMLVLLTARLFLPTIRQYIVPAAAILAISLIVCGVALGRKIDYYERAAIVIAAEVEAKFEPSAGATTYFKLTEGSPVRILDRTAGWTKIRRPDAKIGWVPAGSISAIKE